MRFLAEARRVAPELVVVDAALRDDVAARASGRSASSTTARLGGLQALLRRRTARRRARRRRDALRRPLVRRRPRVTRRQRSYRSLASLQRDNARCRACAEAGYPLESLPVLEGRPGQRAYLFGQAPGIVEGEERRPWRGRAGQTLRRWLELDEDEFYATLLLRLGHALLPGPAAVRPRRPDADAARAGALRVLARLGAAAAAARADRHGRRARAPAAARPRDADRARSARASRAAARS